MRLNEGERGQYIKMRDVSDPSKENVELAHILRENAITQLFNPRTYITQTFLRKYPKRRVPWHSH
ncbi:MAG: hypothetical protein E3J86_13075 [Candidatus Thorarchaeota archaeon]|nr:MAG: hypothetical protein E3J86_13075 [Candidatus Thorarchaeota archaeon]